MLVAPSGKLTYDCSGGAGLAPKPQIVAANPTAWSLVELDGVAAWLNKASGQFVKLTGEAINAVANPSRGEVIVSDAPTLEIPGQTQTYYAQGPAPVSLPPPAPSGVAPDVGTPFVNPYPTQSAPVAFPFFPLALSAPAQVGTPARRGLSTTTIVLGLFGLGLVGAFALMAKE